MVPVASHKVRQRELAQSRGYRLLAGKGRWWVWASPLVRSFFRTAASLSVRPHELPDPGVPLWPDPLLARFSALADSWCALASPIKDPGREYWHLRAGPTLFLTFALCSLVRFPIVASLAVTEEPLAAAGIALVWRTLLSLSIGGGLLPTESDLLQEPTRPRLSDFRSRGSD